MAIANVMKMLNINKKGIYNTLDLVEFLQDEGLLAKTIKILEKSLALKTGDMARLLAVSPRTIERYKVDSRKKLSPHISARLVKIAIAKDRCEEVFEDSKICHEWLFSENVALGGRIPMELMMFDLGIDLVMNELGRIEHGVVS